MAEHVQFLLMLMLAAPLVAVVIALIARHQSGLGWVNLAASLITFACALPLPFMIGELSPTWFSGYVFLDALGAWVILCVAVVYALTSIYALGYMRLGNHSDRLAWFYALFAAFAETMLIAPLVNNLGLYWIAIELTTLVSTFLVGFERGAESIEAAWKYIIIVSAGISLALLGTVILYWGGSAAAGPDYNLSWLSLDELSVGMNPILLRLGFLLLLVGYGTKVGLAPMHTWLPDAHSEGPTPVSAMLSGALLNTAMLGIVRPLQAMDRAGQGALGHSVLVALGLLSLFLSAFFIIRQRGVKRLMAYSSVEHMGIVALGFGFGGTAGVAGALYHMLNHSLTKSLMFFGAGNAIKYYGSQEISRLRGLLRAFPVTGWLWLAGAVAITGAPPFGLFRSEWRILTGGVAGHWYFAVVALLVLLIVIFIGFLNHFRVMYYQSSDQAPTGPMPSVSCRLALWLALVPILVFGFWWPDSLQNVFGVVAQCLGSGSL